MTSIGQTLADARRKRKITVKDVEKAIKIRAKYISALEQDAFDQIVGEAYVIGFLKTYAKWLEIDERPLLDLYREQAGRDSSDPGLLDFPTSDERSRLLRTRAIFGAAFLMIVILLVVKVIIK